MSYPYRVPYPGTTRTYVTSPDHSYPTCHRPRLTFHSQAGCCSFNFGTKRDSKGYFFLRLFWHVATIMASAIIEPLEHTLGVPETSARLFVALLLGESGWERKGKRSWAGRKRRRGGGEILYTKRDGGNHSFSYSICMLCCLSTCNREAECTSTGKPSTYNYVLRINFVIHFWCINNYGSEYYYNSGSLMLTLAHQTLSHCLVPLMLDTHCIL